MKLPRLASAALRKLRGDRRAAVLRAIPENAVCAEIGVWKGDFSERIRATGRSRTLHLIDPWRFVPSYPQRWYGGSAARNQDDMDRIYQDVVRRFASDPHVIIHRLDSEGAAKHLAAVAFDWVYIDGDHSYEAVRNDLQLWAPRIGPGGILAGDDYPWRDEQGNYPVKRAVQDFLAQRTPGKVTIAGDQYLLRL